MLIREEVTKESKQVTYGKQREEKKTGEYGLTSDGLPRESHWGRGVILTWEYQESITWGYT